MSFSSLDHGWRIFKLSFYCWAGHGEFGDVFLARAKGIKETETESLVMVKSLETREETALFNFKREIDMYYKLNHDNICRLIKLCRDTDPHYMIMEYSDWVSYTIIISSH